MCSQTLIIWLDDPIVTLPLPKPTLWKRCVLESTNLMSKADPNCVAVGIFIRGITSEFVELSDGYPANTKALTYLISRDLFNNNERHTVHNQKPDEAIHELHVELTGYGHIPPIGNDVYMILRFE